MVRKQQNTLIKRQQEMKQDFLNQLTQVQSEVQDETLNHLSKEVHDNVGQLLNSTRMFLNVAQKQLPNIPDSFKLAEETLGSAIHELRALSHSMNSDWLKQFDLLQNLDIEIERINRSKEINITISSKPSHVSFSPEKQLIIFRIIQESIQNVIKHAHATKIIIDIQQNEDAYLIKIADNGIGMTTNVDYSFTGIGIRNIKHRVELLGGFAEWQSVNGTIVLIQIPFPNE